MLKWTDTREESRSRADAHPDVDPVRPLHRSASLVCELPGFADDPARSEKFWKPSNREMDWIDEAHFRLRESLRQRKNSNAPSARKSRARAWPARERWLRTVRDGNIAFRVNGQIVGAVTEDNGQPSSRPASASAFARCPPSPLASSERALDASLVSRPSSIPSVFATATSSQSRAFKRSVKNAEGRREGPKWPPRPRIRPAFASHRAKSAADPRRPGRVRSREAGE